MKCTACSPTAPVRKGPNRARLEEKALFALPLAGQSNAAQLLLRPPVDIGVTYMKRLALRPLKNLPKIVPPVGFIAIDTHVHTCYSPDSLADVTQMITRAAHRGLAGIAITDHNAFQGALKAQKIVKRMISEHRLPSTFFVILGEEVSSSQGHIIALYLTHELPPYMTAAETVDAIHQQGGIAIAAHPELECGVGELANTLPFDAVETLNAAEQMHFVLAKSADRDRRVQFYTRVTKPRIGASDAHDPETLGACYTLLTCAPDPKAVREAILAGQTTAMTGMTDEQEKALIHHGLAHLILNAESVKDPTAQGNKVDRGHFSVDMWPRPTLNWSKMLGR